MWVIEDPAVIYVGECFDLCKLLLEMEKEMATAPVHGVAKSQTRLSDFTFFLSVVRFGEGNGNLLQCSCLENPMDRETW